MLSREARNLISLYVSERKRDFYSLSYDEKCALIGIIIRHLPSYDKLGILTDADQNAILPDLVADMFHSSFSTKSLEQLTDGLRKIFIWGIGKSNPAFFLEIQEYFNEEWGEHWPEESLARQLFEDDVRERSNKVKWSHGF